MKKLFLMACTVWLAATSVQAQYPQLTDEAKHLIDSLEVCWKAHSDSAWAVAFPIFLVLKVVVCTRLAVVVVKC